MTTPTGNKTPTKRKGKKRHLAAGRRLMEFPQVKGKTLEDVELSTSAADHSVILRFQDKTELTFGIEPGFTMFATYADCKTGNYRPIKRWPPVRSELFRG